MTLTERCEMTLPELCQALERLHPGWHVWWSDAGKPYATHDYHDSCGCGATVTAPGWPRIEEAIALYEKEREREVQHITAMGRSLVPTLGGIVGAA